MALFPNDMLNGSGGELSLESIAERFSYFFEQIHLLHLQTPSHAEHSALNLWEDIVSSKDAFLEELMGYEGRKVGAYKIAPLINYSAGLPTRTVTELRDFSRQLENYAKLKGYSNIDNMAQDLSGKASKTLYLLTQS